MSCYTLLPGVCFVMRGGNDLADLVNMPALDIYDKSQCPRDEVSIPPNIPGALSPV